MDNTIGMWIEDMAGRFALPRFLVRAVVIVESSGDPWAWNPEPKYRYLVNARTGQPFRKLTPLEIHDESPPLDFPSCPGLPDDRDAEWWGQQASWGLMQVMGAVAREHGFRGWHPQLCDVEQGLRWGCTHLQWLMKRHRGQHGLAGVVKAYNTGRPDSTPAGDAYAARVNAAGGGTALV